MSQPFFQHPTGIHFFSIPYLTKILVFSQVFVYVFTQFAHVPENIFLLNGLLVIKNNQWYRLATFLFLPKFSGNPIFQVISFLFLYFCGTQLENRWGDKLYTLFIFLGYILTLLPAFFFPQALFTNQFIFTSTLIAFAFLMGDTRFLLYFIIPVKARWMAYLYIAFDLFRVYQQPRLIIFLLPGYLAVILMLGFILPLQERRLQQQRKSIKVKFNQAENLIREEKKRTCAECGLSAEEGFETDFRYCEKCEACLCLKHIQTHRC